MCMWSYHAFLCTVWISGNLQLLFSFVKKRVCASDDSLKFFSPDISVSSFSDIIQLEERMAGK